ncbi:hypothetical protein [Mesorhizobium sp. ANAO-SY3R2]|uniref:hypothetical protein n=1 Tax=Mesorhizobium sp. ANAO-SY3R2 TaxID=3166644 RepID=UPI00366F73C3
MNIDKKLRLTAALVGAATRKDLAAAFRRVNPATAFDVDRADKWLQGRSTPRQFSVYEDWIKLLDVPETADWIGDCDIETFIVRICGQHGKDREQLERRALGFGKSPRLAQNDQGATITGKYICYSHAWSPYTEGQLMRSSLVIEQEGGPQRLTATYTEHLPTVLLQAKGQVFVTGRGVYIHVTGTGDDHHFFFTLFPFSSPGSVLGGFMTGAPVFGAQSQPAITRMVLARVREPESQPEILGGYMDPDVMIVDDLRNFGIDLGQQDAEDVMRSFLSPPVAAGVEKISKSDFQRLVDLFDREWLGR